MLLADANDLLVAGVRTYCPRHLDTGDGGVAGVRRVLTRGVRQRVNSGPHVRWNDVDICDSGSRAARPAARR
jgi:hypothetical protein